MDEPIRRWGSAVWGDVLEVGLGAGNLSREIQQNPRVKSHAIVEHDDSLQGSEPNGATMVWGRWPCAGLGKFDCITLDYPGFDFNHFKWCLAHLNEGGAVFIRCL